jgi:predicted phage terminase large subunit-like protein
MNLLEALDQAPHLTSPAALAICDTNGKFQTPPHISCINRLLVNVAFGDSERLIINAPFQHGKLIASDELVWTPSGWKPHGKLCTGDRVFAPDGSVVKVLAVSEPGEATYEVETTDGHKVKCHGAHEWLVHDIRARKWRVLETRIMARRPIRTTGKCKRLLFQLPRILPLKGEWAELPVNPYVLGAWLGDGRSEAGQITHGADDLEVVREIEKHYKKTSSWVQKDTGVCYACFTGLLTDLKSIGVISNKHIPKEYILASEEQRMELLAGLVDTDGNYSKKSGQYRFTNTNRQTIKDVELLARTLGFKVGKVQEYEPAVASSGIVGKKPVYVLAFQATSRIPCRIPRKQADKLCEKCNPAIAAIRTCPPVPGRCIQVEGGLYLVGGNLATTHNSWISSHYFPAWLLLLFPERRILFAAHEERFAASFGMKVKDVIERWGKPVGVSLRPDSKAKNEWVIDHHGGGMVCRGMHGSLTGRPSDIFIIDDPVKDAEQALSATILQKQWDWYQTVAYSRLGPKAPIVLVMTRWCKSDLTGKILREARDSGEDWQHVKIAALATPDDPLGRPLGTPLWPERVPLKRLELIRKQRGRWFSACYQQEPEDDQGGHFKPRKWPVFHDLGDAYSLAVDNNRRMIYLKSEMIRFASLDWAWSTKETADYTALGVYGLTPCGRLLVLDMVNQRVRPEGLAPLLATVCRKWSPRAVAAETGHPLLADQYRRFPEIGEIHWLSTQGKDKLRRALPAILAGENGRIYLPESKPDWYEDFVGQVGAFTGIDDDHEDIVDQLAWACLYAQQLKPTLGTSILSTDPAAGLLVSGKEGW